MNSTITAVVLLLISINCRTIRCGANDDPDLSGTYNNHVTKNNHHVVVKENLTRVTSQPHEREMKRGKLMPQPTLNTNNNIAPLPTVRAVKPDRRRRSSRLRPLLTVTTALSDVTFNFTPALTGSNIMNQRLTRSTSAIEDIDTEEMIKPTSLNKRDDINAVGDYGLEDRDSDNKNQRDVSRKNNTKVIEIHNLSTVNISDPTRLENLYICNSPFVKSKLCHLKPDNGSEMVSKMYRKRRKSIKTNRKQNVRMMILYFSINKNKTKKYTPNCFDALDNRFTTNKIGIKRIYQRTEKLCLFIIKTDHNVDIFNGLKSLFINEKNKIFILNRKKLNFKNSVLETKKMYSKLSRNNLNKRYTLFIVKKYRNIERMENISNIRKSNILSAVHEVGKKITFIRVNLTEEGKKQLNELLMADNKVKFCDRLSARSSDVSLPPDLINVLAIEVTNDPNSCDVANCEKRIRVDEEKLLWYKNCSLISILLRQSAFKLFNDKYNELNSLKNMTKSNFCNKTNILTFFKNKIIERLENNNYDKIQSVHNFKIRDKKMSQGFVTNTNSQKTNNLYQSLRESSERIKKIISENSDSNFQDYTADESIDKKITINNDINGKLRNKRDSETTYRDNYRGKIRYKRVRKSILENLDKNYHDILYSEDYTVFPEQHVLSKPNSNRKIYVASTSVPNTTIQINETAMNLTITNNTTESPKMLEEEKNKQDTLTHQKSVPEIPQIKFSVIPNGEIMKVPDLALENGWFLFTYLGDILSYLQPHDFPIELLRAAVWKKISPTELLIQSVKMEIGFISCIVIGVLIAVLMPSAVLVYACCRLLGLNRNGNSSWNNKEDSCSTDCRRRLFLFFMQIFIILLFIGGAAMLGTNEQLSRAVRRAPSVLHTAMSDAAAYVHNTHLQMHYAIAMSTDEMLEVVTRDLENVEELLGRPVQRELALETGIDVALDALLDVSHGSREIAVKVTQLLEEGQAAQEMARTAQVRIRELRRHIEATLRQCTARDMSLCDTLDPTRLEIVFKIDNLLADHNLAHIRYLGENNLTVAAKEAREEFQFIPQTIVKSTQITRSEIIRILVNHRNSIYESIRILDDLARDVISAIENTRTRASYVVESVAEVEQWRWLTGLCAALSVFLIWLLLLTGISCGCCGAETKAGPSLLIALFFICLFSMALWAIVIASLVIGGHGEVFVCKPLFDEPKYKSLSKLLDNPGLLYKKGGFFTNLINGNDSLEIPVKDILRDCSKNIPAYQTFKLDRIYNINAITNYRNWLDLYTHFKKIKVKIQDLRLLTPDLQRHLQELLQASKANLANFRTQLSGPVTAKDLKSFSNQLESVSNGVSDLTTASRMETLSSRIKKLMDSYIRPLEQNKEKIVYLLTALEVQILPLQRQVNQSIAHLKTIQYYVNNQGATIAEQKTSDYVRRLEKYLEQYRGHVLDQIEVKIAPCKPIWDIYHSTRMFVCRHVVDSLNGFWVATLWCLLLFLGIVPLTIKLSNCYKRIIRSLDLESPLMSDTTANPTESSAWTTPGTQPSDGW